MDIEAFFKGLDNNDIEETKTKIFRQYHIALDAFSANGNSTKQYRSFFLPDNKSTISLSDKCLAEEIEILVYTLEIITGLQPSFPIQQQGGINWNLVRTKIEELSGKTST